MAASALKKNREEVSTDLSGAGFDKKQFPAVVQAVADTAAAMDLATRADLGREVARLEAKIDGIRDEVEDLTELKPEIAVLQAGIGHLRDEINRFGGDLNRIAVSMREFDARVDRLERDIKEIKRFGSNFHGVAASMSALDARVDRIEKDVKEIKRTLDQLPGSISWPMMGGFIVMGFLITVYGIVLAFSMVP